MFWNSIQVVSSIVRQRFALPLRSSPLVPQLAGIPQELPMYEEDRYCQGNVWFAVPKSKVSRSRKRMKTTKQKRIPLKKNIIFDPRTGEVTLKHKLPFNWKDYLPKVE